MTINRLNMNHFPSLENCRKLNEIGFQESELYWDSHTLYPIEEGFGISTDGEYPCPSIAELLDKMPRTIEHKDGRFWELFMNQTGVMYKEKGNELGGLVFFEPLPDALTETLLWLESNNHISFKK